MFAFRSPLSKGAILADEVGLGKTIEAGIVISQKWAERKRRILIILPANLRKQWNQELLDKFFLPSRILEAKFFNQEIKKGRLNPFEQKEIVICSYHFARSKEAYIQQVQWELVVIDEAHRLRNVYKNTNKIANAIKNAVVHAPKILLTATPLQNTLMELYGLVSVIDNYAFGDLKSYKSQYARLTNEDQFDDLKERLKPICKRTLRRQVLEYVKYTNRIPITQEFYPSEAEQRLYDLVSNYLQQPDLYALPSSQRQLMTLILRKLLASSTFAISGTLEALARRLESVLENQPGGKTLDDLIVENFEAYEELNEEWTGDEQENNGDVNAKNKKPFSPEDVKRVRAEIASLHEFSNLAKSIKRNSKGEVLLTALKKGFEQTEAKGSVRKAIIFTESTRTQEYLKSLLENTEFAGKVVLFNGSNTDRKSRDVYQKWLTRHQGTDRVSGSKTADMRSALVDCFRDEAAVMIATEAGAEGINLQFCSFVVNYDLPWNPQRIEQRIGRCHRYGQKHDVVVVNFLNKSNAADQRVYQLLAEKFKLFDGVFGASDEVLGSIESGVDFEKRIARIYQSCRTEDEIQASFDALQAEMEIQIDETMKQARQRLLENFDEEVHEKLRVNLEASKEYLSKYESWLWAITRYYLEAYADFGPDDHSFMLKSNPFPREKIHPGPYRVGKNIEDANLYRIGHPLAQRIIEKCKAMTLPVEEIIFRYSDAPKKISILEPVIGQSGWLRATNVTISSFETEDYLLLNGCCDDGTCLDEDICQRFFSVPAIRGPIGVSIGNNVEKLLQNDFTRKKNAILAQINAKNGSYFETELDKLDKWGEDKRNSLRMTLKEFDDCIKELKKLARLAPNLPEKLQHEKERRNLEGKRDEAWREYDSAARDIEKKKDELIDEIEKKLRQNVTEQELFTIRWKIL